MRRWIDRLPAAAIVLALAWCGGDCPRAAGTSEWRETAETLVRGDLDGIAVTSRGRLFLAPELAPLGRDHDDGPPAQVWAMAADRLGNVYLGTGPEGRVLRVEPSGRTTTFFRVREPLVTALAVLPDGRLLAGTAPEGKIYRISAASTGQEWSRTGERYVWDLAVTGDGRVYAGTGERGVVLRIDESGQAEAFFDSSESHIVRVLPLPQGGLLAAGAGQGLVYEIDPSGHALVLHDDALPEVSDLAVEDDGSIVAAVLAPPISEPLRPAVRIRLPESVEVGAAQGQMEDLREDTGPTLEGTIEGLGVEARPPERPVRGRVVRIRPDGSVQEIWRSPDEAPYALLVDGRGRVLFGTGEPARLYRWEDEGEVTLLATRPEAQVTALLRVGRNELLATSNPGAPFRLDWSAGEPGVFVSAPVDAGSLTRWGTLRWSAEAGPGQIEMFTRTGNSSRPDGTWSAWGPALTAGSGSAVTNPDGRFLQWRLRIAPGASTDAAVRGVRVTYAPYNRPPRLRKVRLAEPSGSYRETVRVTWEEWDPDGDPLHSTLEARERGSTDWIEVATARDAATAPGNGEIWLPRTADWQVADTPEGTYELRVRASDRTRNPPGEGADAVDLIDRVVHVDRTAPELTVEGSGKNWTARALDERSPILRLEVLQAGAVYFAAAPVDGVCDSADERFTVTLPADVSPEGWSIRALDAAGNRTDRDL